MTRKEMISVIQILCEYKAPEREMRTPEEIVDTALARVGTWDDD